MKQIFSYNLPFKAKERVTKKQDDGSEITKEEEVTKTIKVIIKEPSRTDLQAAQDVYQREWSRCVREGIVTRAILDKTYRQDEGILTNKESEEISKIQDRLKEIGDEYAEIEKTPEDLRTEDDKNKIKNLWDEFSEIQSDLQKLDSLNESLYQNTAEVIAGQKQSLYNILFLSFVEVNGKVLPLVAGDTIEQKLNSFDKILDDTSSESAKQKAELYGRILDRNTLFINALARGQIQISQLALLNENLDKEENPPKKEEVKEEVKETKTEKVEVKSPEVEPVVESPELVK